MTKRRPIRAPGMDLNAGDVSGDLRIKPGQKEQPVPVQPVGYPVKEDGVYARIQQKYLQLGSGRRVPGLIGRQSLGKSFEHRVPPILGQAKTPLMPKGMRGVVTDKTRFHSRFSLKEPITGPPVGRYVPALPDALHAGLPWDRFQPVAFPLCPV